MGRRNPVKHVPVEETAIEANVKASVAENGIKDFEVRGQAIVGKIRERYSIQHEMAIQRKTIAKILNHFNLTDAEFDEYNQFVESCKAEVDSEEHNHN